MNWTKLPLIAALAAAIAVAGCESKKSSNPLSPTVAGPIPGVNISTPKVVEPQGGTKIPVDKQPITLTVENASTNGVRPLYYTFEVATDAGFGNKVFTRQNVAQGEGRTSLRLPDALATEKTYYWRAQALDGANTGTPTSATNFDVYTPIVIEAPLPAGPPENSKVASVHPILSVTNVTRTGPAGPITYLFQVGDSTAFTNVVTWQVDEMPGQTVTTEPEVLFTSTTYFWRVRAFAKNTPTAIGPWSRPIAFVTPAPTPAPTPVPAPNPGPGVPSGPAGPVGSDGFNLAAAVIHASPNAAAWPATASITSLSFRSDGVAVEFTKKSGPGRWPDVVPPGWSGPLQYTLWIAMNIGGTWHTCGPIEYWNGLAANGGDVTINNQIAVNWTYYCGPMARQPAPGEQVGFFVTAGDARMKDVAAVHERSNIVVIPFPSAAGQTFTF
jgi:hypothetical protein